VIGFISRQPQTSTQTSLNLLRLDGLNYISPLLACDGPTDSPPPELLSLQKKLDQLIIQNQQQPKIDTASIYLRQFKSGHSLTLYPEIEYNPASLIKIPMLMVAYQQAQTNPDFLNQTATYDLPDHNLGQEIPPEESLQPGQEYTLNQALEYLIKYSDNNAYHFLTTYLKLEDYAATFHHLKIPLPVDNDITDYLKVEDFSYFLRVLYNASYLNNRYSQSALQLMTQSTYKQGLVAGVPNTLDVAHKYGLKSFTENGVVVKRQLHDCGIFYLPQNPYLLCIMTSSHDQIPAIESVIQSLSREVYQSLSQQ